MSKIINSKSKWLIECDGPNYRIGDTFGTLPPNCDCIISGWHFKSGRIVKKGLIKLIPGAGKYIMSSNTIE